MSIRLSNVTRSLIKQTVAVRPFAQRIIPASTRFLSSTPINQFTSTPKMASILASTAAAAHSAVASLASVNPVKVGDAFPDATVKINDPESTINFSTLTGKNIIVAVPGAFTPSCSSQVPGYIEKYDEFAAKGVKDIYVVSVNDIFVVNAWKEKLSAEKSTKVIFTGDDAGKLASALGLVLDAQGVLGGPRLKRAAIVIDNGKVVHLAVEDAPPNVTVTSAESVLKAL